MEAVLGELNITRAELARRAGLPEGRIRSYISQKTDNPRGDVLERIARELGVELLWLRDGIEPKRSGDEAVSPVDDARANLDAQAEFGDRMRISREERGLSVARACAGLTIGESRWRSIETGHAAPTLVELQVISERLRASLDWLVSGWVGEPLHMVEPTHGGQAVLHDKASAFAHRHPPGVKK